MTIQKSKTNINSKATVNNKNKGLVVKKKKKRRKRRERTNSKLLVLITFFSGVLLIISTYAWLSVSLNVKIKFFDMTVSSNSGLFISLDGIEFSDQVEISLDNVITNLKTRYPSNTNQWASGGLWPVSSNGIKTLNNDKFDVYIGEVSRYKLKTNRRKFLNTRLYVEDKPNSANAYIAFDIFLKNVSGSPRSDNLYLDSDTAISFADETDPNIIDSMTNIMNSMRFGFVIMGSVPSKSDVNIIQNMRCINTCKMLIFEPNSVSHSDASITKAEEFGITLIDGVYSPTYAVINEGNFLAHVNGQEGSGIPLDIDHFTLQNTIKDFKDPVYEIPNAITKIRVYVWIEGQDMDSLETTSEGAAIDIAINFIKDLAGYE